MKDDEKEWCENVFQIQKNLLDNSICIVPPPCPRAKLLYLLFFFFYHFFLFLFFNKNIYF
jgi:hypothetical protein